MNVVKIKAELPKGHNSGCCHFVTEAVIVWVNK